MKERGFMPFTAVGAIIIMLVVAIVGRAAWSRHERSLYSINGAESDAVLTSVMGIQNDLKHVARYAVYKALWDVSKRADHYNDSETREGAIESLARRYFSEFVEELPRNYQNLDARVELEIQNAIGNSSFDMRAEGDFASANVKLSKKSQISASTWDNGLSITLPLGDFDVFVDSRYYLLQNRMDEFLNNGLEGIRETWRNIEYLLAWTGAWAGIGVNLNEACSKAIFELAWAKQELDTFGSADYIATAMKLSGIGGGTSGPEVLSTISNPPAVIPLRAVDIEPMNGFINRALNCLSLASSDLTAANAHLACAKGSILQIPDNAENTTLIESARTKLDAALSSISQSKNRVREAHQHFNQLVEFTAQAASNDFVMAAIHDGLTKGTTSNDYVRGNYPSLREQVEKGANGIEDKIDELTAMVQTQLNTFSSDNISLIKNLVSNFYGQANALIQGLLDEPSPKRWVEFDLYDEPGAIDETPNPANGAVPVYIDDERDGKIRALEVILQSVKASLETMGELSERTEPPSGELQGVEIDEGLRQGLETDTRGFETNREGLYEILPPPPLRSQPGLSVFHNFNIKSIRYEREDPVGWLVGQNAPPTPIWLIFFTLWYAQWEVTLELEEGPIEEIFDFANPTLPRSHELSEILGNKIAVDVHKPLAYRHGVQRRTFSFKLVIISLRGFSIAQS